ncbi:L-glutamate gamma-semialdehyde dehydrogenase [Altericista sp. CCNU0014]|uniref:L-glutamate gamma-semialdehyde dehydrogenase n=1 Tax=Altericista sp. CCNU0014 TaxID=3082949 RepID=UPI00385159BE
MISTVTPQTYERDTQAIAQKLIAAMQGGGSWLTQLRDRAQLEDKLLTWTMSNPGLRVQLFRLIDVLPTLSSKAEIARHLQEYLAVPGVELPSTLKQLLNFAAPDSLPGQVAATTFTAAVSALAHRYIAGESLPQVLKTIEKLNRNGMAFTVDMLGEAVITEKEAHGYLQQYLDLMTQLAQNVPTGTAGAKVQVSVKLTAFYSQFDPLDGPGSQAQVSDRLRTLLRHAQTLGVAVHFDMEQYTYKTITLEILKALLMEPEFRDRTDIGITLQAYLRDSYQDLHGTIEWAKLRGAPLTVRLVKGAYWDQETIQAIQKGWPQPVYSHKAATDANFERMTQLLLENHGVLHAAIGSHNVRSQAKAIAMANALQIPSGRFEMQVLYGMADKLAKALHDQGHRVRVYCPYGKLIPGMSYLIRRLLENTANSSFLKQSSAEGAAMEALLAPPEVPAQELVLPRSHFHAADPDYAQENLRHQAHQALASVKSQLGRQYWPFINGEATLTASSEPSVNPSEPATAIGQVGQATLEMAEQAMAAAKTAFPMWAKTPVRERADLLRRVADLMAQRRQELAAWMVLEVGKVQREADGEVSEAIDFCRYYADEMERLDAGYDRDLAGETNAYRYHPRGVAVVISPWNFPLAIPTGMVVAALVTGNCTILKPAAPSAVIAAKLAEILMDAGVPAGVFQYLPGSGSQLGPYLTKHPDVHIIAFTGSQSVGCRIYADAAILQPGQKHLKRVIAEMGGKNGIIVDQSADLDQAVAGVVKSAFGYGGQKCSACSRAIVLDAVYDTFVQRLIEATQSLNVGIAENPGTAIGPVISAEARDHILGYIAQGNAEATLALAEPVPESGYFVSPTIFTDVPSNGVLAQEEIFGPVLAVIRAKSFEEALAIANNTQYALTGGLYSRTPSHIERAKAEFEVGNLYINRNTTGAIVDRQPFGGFKLSGVGSKAGGRDYLLQFLEPKVITENVQRQGFAPIEGIDL